MWRARDTRLGREVAIKLLPDEFAGDEERLLVTAEDHEVTPFLASRHCERAAVFSPSSRYVAYTSDEEGGDEVYVLPFPAGPAGGKREKVSTGGEGAGALKP